MATRRHLQLIFFLVFCVPGMLVVGYAVHLTVSAARFSHAGTTTMGTIVRYDRQEYVGKVGRRFCPVIEFMHDGARHAFTAAWCNKSQKKYPPGSAIAVVFDADHPAAARIDEFWALYANALLSGVIGVPWLLLGIALVVRVR
ncbi:MAG TPA: DUF3592 domain-containing protein [Rhodanobacteraceae bacterium]|nr:DUF3592 domain-containing protein [Rhodanobacteraceae bacterium]